MNDSKKKQHTVMMSDADWQDLKETAAASGMRVSPFIIHRLAAVSGDADDARIRDTLARMERSLACLEEIERLRLADDPETWKAVNERVDARLALERKLDR
ncbi:MAG: hypothetical protein OXD40_08580 [bacterium]|nr:hypothetical protein [bacterium]